MENKKNQPQLPESVRQEATKLLIAGESIINVSRKLNTNYSQMAYMRKKLVQAGVVSRIHTFKKRPNRKKSVAAKVRNTTPAVQTISTKSAVTKLTINGTRIDIHSARQVIVMNDGVKVLY